MQTTIRAKYQDGVFVPILNGGKLDLPEVTEVELTIEVIGSTDAGEPKDKTRKLREIAERMRANSFQGDPPHFSREELHERS